MIESVLILYEEELLADGLKRIINDINESVVVSTHTIYDDLGSDFGDKQYDMIIISKNRNLDISFVCTLIHNKSPECKIVFISNTFTNDDVKRFLEFNVDGLICKKYSIAKIRSIMSLLLLGETYYPTEVLPYANKTFLSSQQMKIVKCLRQGYSNKQIAYDLHISESTVKAHMTIIMRKLNVVNRVQVTQKALEMGLLEY